jgi:hypothetical protein
VKKGDVNAACQAAVGKNPPQNVYTKIMKELATSSGPSWVRASRNLSGILKLTA